MLQLHSILTYSWQSWFQHNGVTFHLQFTTKLQRSLRWHFFPFESAPQTWIFVGFAFLVEFNKILLFTIGHCWRKFNLSVFIYIPSSCTCLLSNIPAEAKFAAEKFTFVINLFCAIKGKKMHKYTKY